MKPTLSTRELATILAALRSWQLDLVSEADADHGPRSDHFNDVITPLSAEEIDDLCERLNCS